MRVPTATPDTRDTQAGAPSLVVIDERGDLFAMLRSMQLDAAIWRTASLPRTPEVSESTLIIFVAYDRPDWDAIRESARRYPTVVVAKEAHEEDRMLALRSGAFGYVDLSMPEPGLRRTLRGALVGEPAFPRELLGRWMREGQFHGRITGRGPRAERLTARQREIVALIASGATDKEIGTALGIRAATAQKHVANLLRRLGVSNRAGAVGLLLKEGEVLPAVHRPDRRRR